METQRVESVENENLPNYFPNGRVLLTIQLVEMFGHLKDLQSPKRIFDTIPMRERSVVFYIAMMSVLNKKRTSSFSYSAPLFLCRGRPASSPK